MAETRRVAFVSPPGWFDVSPSDLLTVAPSGWEVMQAVVPLPGFTYGLDAIKKARPAIERMGKLIAESSPDAIVQTGTPWAGFSLERYRDVVRFRDRMETATGTIYLSAGIAVPDALRRLGARTIAIAGTYYDDAWLDAYTAYLTDAGFAVAAAEGFRKQELVEGSLPLATGPFPRYSARILGASVAAVGLRAQRADAIVVAGTHRTLASAGDLELAAGRPIVATDLALHWSVLDRLGAGPVHGHGKMMGLIGT